MFANQACSTFQFHKSAEVCLKDSVRFTSIQDFLWEILSGGLSGKTCLWIWFVSRLFKKLIKTHVYFL